MSLTLVNLVVNAMNDKSYKEARKELAKKASERLKSVYKSPLYRSIYSSGDKDIVRVEVSINQ